MFTPFLQTSNTSNTSKPPPIPGITMKKTGLKAAVGIIGLQKITAAKEQKSLSPLPWCMQWFYVSSTLGSCLYCIWQIMSYFI